MNLNLPEWHCGRRGGELRKPRFEEMRSFFAGVGEGETSGIWSEQPQPRPEFREAYRRKLDKQAKARKAEELP